MAFEGGIFIDVLTRLNVPSVDKVLKDVKTMMKEAGDTSGRAFSKSFGETIEAGSRSAFDPLVAESDAAFRQMQIGMAELQRAESQINNLRAQNFKASTDVMIAAQKQLDNAIIRSQGLMAEAARTNAAYRDSFVAGPLGERGGAGERTGSEGNGRETAPERVERQSARSGGAEFAEGAAVGAGADIAAEAGKEGQKQGIDLSREVLAHRVADRLAEVRGDMRKAARVGGLGSLLALTGMVGYGVRAGGRIQNNLAQLSSLQGESPSNIAMITKATWDQAVQTGFGTNDISKLYPEAERAVNPLTGGQYRGNEAKNVVGNALMLARITGVEPKEALQGLTTSLFNYHMGPGQASSAGNILAQGLAGFKGSAGDFFEAQHTIDPVAEMAGVGMPEVIAALDQMSQTGQSAQQSGQSLRNLIKALARPNSIQSGALQQMGINPEDMSVNLAKNGIGGTLTDIMAQVAGHTKQVGPDTAAVVMGAMANKPLMQQQQAEIANKLSDQAKSYIETPEFQKSLVSGFSAKNILRKAGAANVLSPTDMPLLETWLNFQKKEMGASDLLKRNQPTVANIYGAMTPLFGTQEAAQSAIMLGGSPEALQAYKDRTNAMNTAKNNPNAFVDSFNKAMSPDIQKWHQLGQELGKLSARIGSDLLPVIGSVVDHFKGFLEWTDQHKTVQKALIDAMLGLAGFFVAQKIGLTKVFSKLGKGLMNWGASGIFGPENGRGVKGASGAASTGADAALEQAAETLQTGASTFGEAVPGFSEAVAVFREASTVFSEGATSFAGATGAFEAGSTKLDTGAAALETGAGTLETAAGSLETAATALDSAAAQEDAASARLAGAADGMVSTVGGGMKAMAGQMGAMLLAMKVPGIDHSLQGQSWFQNLLGPAGGPVSTGANAFMGTQEWLGKQLGLYNGPVQFGSGPAGNNLPGNRTLTIDGKVATPDQINKLPPDLRKKLGLAHGGITGYAPGGVAHWWDQGGDRLLANYGDAAQPWNGSTQPLMNHPDMGGDTLKGVMPDGSPIGLRGGEGILTPEAVQALGGEDGINQINKNPWSNPFKVATTFYGSFAKGVAKYSPWGKYLVANSQSLTALEQEQERAQKEQQKESKGYFAGIREYLKLAYGSSAKYMPGYYNDMFNGQLGNVYHGGGGGGMVGGNPAIMHAIGSAAADMGLDQEQYNAVKWIFSHESGFDPTVSNGGGHGAPSNYKAFGLGQFLGHMGDKYGQMGAYSGDPGLETKAAITYMIDRYGSPEGAKAYWQTHGNYAKGGVVGFAPGGILPIPLGGPTPAPPAPPSPGQRAGQTLGQYFPGNPTLPHGGPPTTRQLPHIPGNAGSANDPFAAKPPGSRKPRSDIGGHHHHSQGWVDIHGQRYRPDMIPGGTAPGKDRNIMANPSQQLHSEGKGFGIGGGLIGALESGAAGMGGPFGAAAQPAFQLINRAIGYGGQLVGIGIKGLMETFLPNDSPAADPSKNIFGKIALGMAGAHPSGKNAAGAHAMQLHPKQDLDSGAMQSKQSPGIHIDNIHNHSGDHHETFKAITKATNFGAATGTAIGVRN